MAGTNASVIVAVNGSHHTLKRGEEFALKTQEGPVTIRCEEIKSSSVVMVIPLTGVKRELRPR
jgi:hypothetical protein